MAWSLAISEPIGTLGGIVAGELTSCAAKKVSKACGFSPTVSTLLTTTSGHFVGAVATKAIINVSLGDPIGLGITPITSGVTAVGHGLLKAYVKPQAKRILGVA